MSKSTDLAQRAFRGWPTERAGTKSQGVKLGDPVTFRLVNYIDSTDVTSEGQVWALSQHDGYCWVALSDGRYEHVGLDSIKRSAESGHPVTYFRSALESA